ncbi:MAG: hypothetical protein AAGI44_10905 [Pseudomonadota bacterium]
MSQTNTRAETHSSSDASPALDASTENAATDRAAELIDALDQLLLERAVREHREALSRLNTLQQALNKDETD